MQRGIPDGIAAMTKVLEKHPYYIWGWGQLIHWLRGSQPTPESVQSLRQEPPILHGLPQLRRARLELLGLALPKDEKLDSEWETLLADFPEHPSLLLARYDSLFAARRFDDAAAVLSRYEAVCKSETSREMTDGASDTILGRRAELYVEAGTAEEALKIAENLFFGPDSGTATEALNRALEAAKRGDLHTALMKRVLRGIKAGHRPNAIGTFHLANYILSAKRGQHGGNSEWPPAPLPELLKNASNVQIVEVLLERFNEFGFSKAAIRFWKEQGAKYAASSEAWAQVGHAYTVSGYLKAAQQHLAHWRERPGCHLWAVSNLIQVFPGNDPRALTEKLNHGWDALERLRHDLTARHLAHAIAGCAIALNDKALFERIWHAHKGYFTGKTAPGDWFPTQDAALLQLVPKLGNLLESYDPTFAVEFGRGRQPVRTIQSRSHQQSKPQGSEYIHLAWIAIVVLAVMLRMCSAAISGPTPVPQNPPPSLYHPDR
jgi:tetratricopeptide (TPR) repeat protein